MRTTRGKKIHFVGVGVCGQRIYQLQLHGAEEEDHDGWLVCRLEGKYLIALGKSGKRYLR